MASYCNPNLPFVTICPGGNIQPGDTIILKGLVVTRSNAKRFEVNLCCGLLVEGDHVDNIALHFNPRFQDDVVVLNALINQKWGVEERQSMPFQSGNNFEIRILAQTDCYKIAVNGMEYCDFKHRVALADVKTLYIKGCVKLDFVSFETAHYIHPALDSPAEQRWQIKPLLKPPVPFCHPIALEPRRQICLTAVPRLDAFRFYINFNCGKDNVAFHFNPRFKEKLLVRNTMRNGRWDKNEERDTKTFPFVAGAMFDIAIDCEVDGYKVAINGQYLLFFAHRLPYQQVDQVEVDGDVRIQQFQANTLG